VVYLKIGLNTGLFVDLDIMSTLKLTSEIGYEGVEISHFHSIEKERGDEIFDLASSLNLEVFCVQGGNPYTDPSFMKERIEMASRVGARFVNLGPGLPVKSKDDKESRWNDTISTFAELLEYAGERGVSLAVEPEPRFDQVPAPCVLSSYTKDVSRMIDEFPELWTIIDLNHIQAFRESLPKVANMFQDRIAFVHISDQIDRRHLHLMPGKGETDFGSALKMLEYSGYDDFLTIELNPYYDVAEIAAREAFEYLMNLLYHMDMI